MEALGLELDLIRRTGSFKLDREVELVLGGEVGQSKPVDTGIPQGSLLTSGADSLHHLSVRHLRRRRESCTRSPRCPLQTTLPGGRRERTIRWWQGSCQKQQLHNSSERSTAVSPLAMKN